jgi:type IV secretion system protein VirB6
LDLITQLFNKVDTLSTTAVQSIYQALSSSLLPVFTVALTIYVAYWGYEMIFGRAPVTAPAFIWRVVRIAIIYSLAFGWSDFSALVVPAFAQFGDTVASAVCTGVGGTSCSSSVSSVSTLISKVFDAGMTASKAVGAGAGYTAIGLYLISAIILVTTVIFVALAVTFVMVGKVALFILLGLAPVFIAMALFQFSSPLMSGWLRTCAQYSIVPVVVYGMLSFLLNIMQATITNVGSITDVSSGLTVIAPFLILCIVGTIMVPQSVSIAASIAGGHALRNPLSAKTWAGFLAMPRVAATGAGYAGRGAAAGGRMIYNYYAERPALAAPGANTMQAPPSRDPRAQQVSSALTNARESRT